MSSKQPAQGTFGRHHAVVIGGSMTGLLAARVLSDHFEQVTIIERDRLIEEAEPRKGVPQGRHVHGWLARGVAIMSEYFPDLFPTLAQDGAILVSMEDLRWNQLGVWMTPVRSPVKILFQSRPFLEQHVRDQLATRDNVRIMDACEVSQLCAHKDGITCVVLLDRDGGTVSNQLHNGRDRDHSQGGESEAGPRNRTPVPSNRTDRHCRNLRPTLFRRSKNASRPNHQTRWGCRRPRADFVQQGRRGS